jgi:hypothetical protein
MKSKIFLAIASFGLLDYGTSLVNTVQYQAGYAIMFLSACALLLAGVSKPVNHRVGK